MLRAEIKLWHCCGEPEKGRSLPGEIRESFRKGVRAELGLEAKKARKGQGEGKDIYME